MKIISLDVHAQRTQLCVSDADGTIVLEKAVETRCDCLREAVRKIPGPKAVVFEHGPLSGFLVDALAGLDVEIVSADPARNAMIARAEDSNDERDARRLGTLQRAKALRAVYVPPAPFRVLRALTSYEEDLTRQSSRVMSQLKALCRRFAIRYRGKHVYRKPNRPAMLEQLPSDAMRGLAQSLYRRLDQLRSERIVVRRILRRESAKLPVCRRLETIPGIGPVTARVIVAWIVNPERFKKFSGLCSYAGVGLSQNVTGWRATRRPRASRRGQRHLKRALFQSARGALRGSSNALKQRYDVRVRGGWEPRKATRDLVRTLLRAIVGVWKTKGVYDDGRIKIPPLG